MGNTVDGRDLILPRSSKNLEITGSNHMEYFYTSENVLQILDSRPYDDYNVELQQENGLFLIGNEYFGALAFSTEKYCKDYMEVVRKAEELKEVVGSDAYVKYVRDEDTFSFTGISGFITNFSHYEVEDVETPLFLTVDENGVEKGYSTENFSDFEDEEVDRTRKAVLREVERRISRKFREYDFPHSVEGVENRLEFDLDVSKGKGHVRAYLTNGEIGEVTEVDGDIWVSEDENGKNVRTVYSFEDIDGTIEDFYRKLEEIIS